MVMMRSFTFPVQVLDWAPQNDLLAHPQIRAFVSHAGINSVYEVIQVTLPAVRITLREELPFAMKRLLICEESLQ